MASRDTLAQDAKAAGIPTPGTPLVHEVEAAAAGAAAGAVAGLIAGPVGAAIGAVIGGAIGAVAESVVERDEEASVEHDAELDETIGVTSGEIGAPNLAHPPAKVGAFSGGSMGVSSGGGTAAEGPFEAVDD